MEEMIITAYGWIKVRRCQAKSKRTGNLCGIAAARWKRACKWHGGKRTGARALEGRAQCTAEKTVHGEDSQALRETSSTKMREMKELFNILPR
jgi:hypothetical protein